MAMTESPSLREAALRKVVASRRPSLVLREIDYRARDSTGSSAGPDAIELELARADHFPQGSTTASAVSVPEKFC
jgi:hypothetical protein